MEMLPFPGLHVIFRSEIVGPNARDVLKTNKKKQRSLKAKLQKDLEEAVFSGFRVNFQGSTYIYTYIYIYVCVCVYCIYIYMY